jgi:hypothetical protein
MFFTWLIEWLLAVYALIKYRQSKLGLLGVSTLILLGTFQLAEYMICTQGGGEFWVKSGYLAITWLPPLGALMVDRVVGRRSLLSRAGLFLGVLISLMVLAINITSACRGNYAIFYLYKDFGIAYGAYYLGLLFLTVWQIYQYIESSKSKPRKRTLSFMLLGYASFLVPTALVVAFSPEAYGGTPSIMCGFALLYALILAFQIIPSTTTKS